MKSSPVLAAPETGKLEVQDKPTRLTRSSDQNRVLRFVHRSQDGSYGCSIKSIAERVRTPTGRDSNAPIGWERAADAVDALIALRLVRCRKFLGMEEFLVTNKGAAIAKRLKFD